MHGNIWLVWLAISLDEDFCTFPHMLCSQADVPVDKPFVKYHFKNPLTIPSRRSHIWKQEQRTSSAFICLNTRSSILSGGHFVLFFLTQQSLQSVSIMWLKKNMSWAGKFEAAPHPHPLQLQVWAGDLMWTNSTAARTRAEIAMETEAAAPRSPGGVQCAPADPPPVYISDTNILTPGCWKKKQTQSHMQTREDTQRTSRMSSDGTQPTVIYTGNAVKQLH